MRRRGRFNRIQANPSSATGNERVTLVHRGVARTLLNQRRSAMGNQFGATTKGRFIMNAISRGTYNFPSKEGQKLATGRRNQETTHAPEISS